MLYNFSFESLDRYDNKLIITDICVWRNLFDSLPGRSRHHRRLWLVVGTIVWLWPLDVVDLWTFVVIINCKAVVCVAVHFEQMLHATSFIYRRSIRGFYIAPAWFADLLTSVVLRIFRSAGRCCPVVRCCPALSISADGTSDNGSHWQHKSQQ